MKNANSIIQALGVLTLGASLPGLQGQTPSPNIEQQLRSQYRIPSVLVVAQDGIKASPPSMTSYWYNSHKPGNGIKYSGVFDAMVAHYRNQMRLLQVGDRVRVTRMEVKANEVVFYVQTHVDNPNDVTYRANVFFQFQQKGYVQPANLKAIQDSIAEVFTIDTSAPTQGSGPSSPSVTLGGDPRVEGERPPARPVAPPLKLPATYVSAQTPADQLQLRADNSFSLQEAGQTYGGTFAANGNALELSIRDTNTKNTLTIQGNNLTDGSGQAWVLREQPAPGAAPIQNEDVIKMVKAGLDDALIIAKIGSSKCQFDTSTDALIQLKQSGVSAAVLKEMVGAGK